MAPRKKPKYGPAGSPFSKQAIAYYRKLEKQNRAGGGGRGSFKPAPRPGAPPAAPSPKAVITKAALDQQKARELIRIAEQRRQTRARPQQFAGARGGGGLIGSKPPAKPAPKPEAKPAPKAAPKRGGKSAFDVVDRLQSAGLTPTSKKAKAQAREDAERKHRPFAGIPGLGNPGPRRDRDRGRGRAGPEPLAAPKGPSPEEILAYTQAANRRREPGGVSTLDLNDPLDVYLAAISETETGGEADLEAYQQPGSGGGARGRYQFIDSTWRGAGGGRYAPTANLATPAQQDEIMREYSRGNLGRVGGDFGRLAKQHYTGQPDYPDYSVPGPQAGNRLTAGQYRDRILNAMRRLGWRG